MRGRGESQAVTNTKSINLGATDSVRAAVRREDEKMERRQSRLCKVVRGHVARCIHVRDGGVGERENVQIRKMGQRGRRGNL